MADKFLGLSQFQRKTKGKTYYIDTRSLKGIGTFDAQPEGKPVVSDNKDPMKRFINGIPEEALEEEALENRVRDEQKD